MSVFSPENSPALNAGFRVGLALHDTGWHPGSWFRISGTQEIFTAAYWAGLALIAEEGEADFVTFEDSLGLQRNGQLDASLVASYLAARTASIGLIPTLTTTHTEPFHLSKNLATLDYISQGRAGWQVEVSRSAAESALFGRSHPAAQFLPEGSPAWLDELYAESEEAVEVVRRLWDSWEHDAEIRDTTTGRFIDRQKLHYIDYQGKRFSVKGPSITPRPPQGHPVISFQGQEEAVIKAAVTSSDLLFIEPADATEAAQALRRVRDTERTFARKGQPLAVYADITVAVADTTDAAQARWAELDAAHGQLWSPEGEVAVGSAEQVADRIAAYVELGFSGVRLKPAEHDQDVAGIAERLLPELIRREIFTPEPAPTLRSRLGLVQAENRYSPGRLAALGQTR